VFAARSYVGDPAGEAVGVGQDLDVAAMVFVFSAPPQVRAVRAGCFDAVGVDQRAVQVQVGGAGGLGGEQCLMDVGGQGGEHVDTLVQAGVRGGQGDGVVGGQLSDAGGVQEPAQHEHGLAKRAQRAGASAGAALHAACVQQRGQGVHRLTA